MKTIIASVLAAGALAAAGAVSAQTSLDDRMDRIEARIDQGVDEGSLTPGQADQLRGQLWSVRNRRDRLDNVGLLNTWRRQDLSARLDRIAYEVSRDRYFARYGTFRGYRQEWDWGEQEPYQAPPAPAQPYQGRPNQAQPNQGQPYQGGYQGYYYQGEPNYQAQPYQAQPYQGQGGYQGYYDQAPDQGDDAGDGG